MDDSNHTTTKNEEVKSLHKKPFVLHIITRASWGGAQRYVYDIAIDTKEYIQAVATESSGALVDELRKQGVTVYPLSYARRSILPLYDLRTFFDIIHLLRRVKPDVVHLHSSKMGLIGGLACRIVGTKKIIFTIHGWPYNEDRPKPILFIFKALSLITLMCSHKAIAVSKAVMRTRPFGFLGNKITQIYLAIQQPKYKEKNKAREVLLRKTPFIKDINSEIILFGIIGELTKNKGHSTLFKAFKEVNLAHPETKLICIGNGSMLPELHTLARNLEIDDNIAWIHNLNDAAIFMKAFDVVVTSSYTEALGYAPLEAGLASVARVATNVGGLPEIIKNDVTGLLVPRGDENMLAKALIKCVENENLRNRLGEQARVDLQPFTDLKKMRSSVYELYGE
ncbi:MAG: glycosyltransferase family 4 protein [Candidatus Paceibacterota bacterium]|jgi:glycosyltransferase involved in cell wall biosynthesis